MLCARCLRSAVKTRGVGDLTAVPAAETVFGGEALCLSHFIQAADTVASAATLTLSDQPGGNHE